MRKIYTCKACSFEFSVINNGFNVILSCPHCRRNSPNSDVEGWAGIKYKSFDEDIKQDAESGLLEKMMFGEGDMEMLSESLTNRRNDER